MSPINSPAYTSAFIAELALQIHDLNAKWWQDLETGAPIERNPAELIALIHSELSEALEGVRKDLYDDHLPEFKSEVVEMADAIIRILDYCGGRGLPIGQALVAKLQYNTEREDHKHEARKQKNGKKF